MLYADTGASLETEPTDIVTVIIMGSIPVMLAAIACLLWNGRNQRVGSHVFLNIFLQPNNNVMLHEVLIRLYNLPQKKIFIQHFDLKTCGLSFSARSGSR